MKPMQGSCFIDTNVLIYCYSATEPAKKQKALEVSNIEQAIISTQVLKEFSNTLSKKFRIDWGRIEQSVNELATNFMIYINTPRTIQNACSIASKYGFSFYDSLIVESALETKCNILYSEDLQHNQLIEKKLRIINPFVEDEHS